MRYKEIHTVFEVKTLVGGFAFHDQPYETIVYQFRYDQILPYASPSVIDEYIDVFGLEQRQDKEVGLGKKSKLIGAGTKEKVRSFIDHNIGRYGNLGKEYNSGALPVIPRNDQIDSLYKYIVAADRAVQSCGRQVHLVTENEYLHELSPLLLPLSINVVAGLDYLTLLGL